MRGFVRRDNEPRHEEDAPKADREGRIRIRGMPLSVEGVGLIASLRPQITVLQIEVADLRRQENPDSSNISKPPSSDELRKKPRIKSSLRRHSGKPSAGLQAMKLERYGKSPIPTQSFATGPALGAIVVGLWTQPGDGDPGAAGV